MEAWQKNGKHRWSINEWYKAAARDLQKLARLRAADNQGFCQCVTCGKRAQWKAMQGGHFITRARRATMLDPQNVHPQCVACNDYGHGKPAEYLEFMLAAYGAARVEALRLKSKQKVSLKAWEIHDIRESFRAAIKVEEERLGLKD